MEKYIEKKNKKIDRKQIKIDRKKIENRSKNSLPLESRRTPHCTQFYFV